MLLSILKTFKASSSGDGSFPKNLLMERRARESPRIKGASQYVRAVQQPKLTEIAFPPLKFKKGENACPKTAKPAERTVSMLPIASLFLIKKLG